MKMQVLDTEPIQQPGNRLDHGAEDQLRDRGGGCQIGVAGHRERAAESLRRQRWIRRVDSSLQRRVERLQPLVGIDQARRLCPQVGEDLGLSIPGRLGQHGDRLGSRRRIPALSELDERQGAVDGVGVIVGGAGSRNRTGAPQEHDDSEDDAESGPGRTAARRAQCLGWSAWRAGRGRRLLYAPEDQDRAS